jgi:hypothetical protein
MDRTVAECRIYDTDGASGWSSVCAVATSQKLLS